MSPDPPRSPSTRRPAAALGGLCLLAALGPAGGCASDGTLSYDSVYSAFVGEEPPPTPTEAVAMAFNRDDPDQRRRGVGWLASAPFGGEAEYLATYRLLVSDPHPAVRAAVAKALGMHGSVEDANLLALMLSDDDPLVRWQAADALRKLHNPSAAPALAARLNPDVEEDDDTRAAAAAALGQYPDRVVLSRLTAALEDRSFAVVNAAHQSLIQLTGHDAGLDPRDWSDWAATNAEPFKNQQPYTYRPYQPKRGWFDSYVTFWNNQNKGPQTPKGMSRAGGE
jgi:hypothetical protein